MSRLRSPRVSVARAAPPGCVRITAPPCAVRGPALAGSGCGGLAKHAAAGLPAVLSPRRCRQRSGARCPGLGLRWAPRSPGPGQALACTPMCHRGSLRSGPGGCRRRLTSRRRVRSPAAPCGWLLLPQLRGAGPANAGRTPPKKSNLGRDFPLGDGFRWREKPPTPHCAHTRLGSDYLIVCDLVIALFEVVWTGQLMSASHS